MIRCPRCDNETRTSELITQQGTVMLAGTLGSQPVPVIAQVCTACGHIELFAPQPSSQPKARHSEHAIDPALVPAAQVPSAS